MAFDLDNLLRCLELEPRGPGVAVGQHLDIDYRRVFGGQILGQFIVAATEATPGKSVKSLHALFPREGDTSCPMEYHVDLKQNGRTFGTIEIVALQQGKVVAVATASVHADEDGMHRSDRPPDVGLPADATPRDFGIIPFEIRVVDDVDLSDRQVGPAQFAFWVRTPRLRELGEDRRSIHQALLAHATDLTIIGTALRPFAGVSQRDSNETIHTAVTSHTVWFHQPFRLDDWLLITQTSPVVANGRAFGRGDVFTEAGELVASFAQESMIRAL